MLADLLLLAARWAFFISALASFGMALFPFYAPDATIDDRLPRAALLSAVGVALSTALWFGVSVFQFAGSFEAWLETARTVIFETTFGTAWGLRLVAVVLLPILCLAKSSLPRLAISGLVLATEPWLGHLAVASPLARLLHIVHLLAAGAWLGGLLPLRWSLQDAGTDIRGATQLLRRFSTLGILCVGLIAITGISNCSAVGDLAPHLDASYQKWLFAKIALFLAMVVVAAENRLLLLPGLDLTGSRGLDRLQRNIVFEQALALAVLLAVTQLGVTSPA